VGLLVRGQAAIKNSRNAYLLQSSVQREFDQLKDEVVLSNDGLIAVIMRKAITFRKLGQRRYGRL
jgi:hypothetical protein